MSDLLSGVKVLEVAIFGFVPSAGAVLADWGAEVIKIEHPVHGDPMRGVTTSGLVPGGDSGVNFLWEIMNRGKQSVGIDVGHPDGLKIVLELAASADVFLTNFLPAARRRLGIDVDDIRRVNPSIIYGRGSGLGPRGPEAESGGFDGASFWARTGASDQAMDDNSTGPVPLPGPAYGDVTSGMTLAGGIAAALFRRERTGVGAVVDVSLLGAGMWAMSPGIVASGVVGIEKIPQLSDTDMTNPLVRDYTTQDARVLNLCMLEGDRHWTDLCTRIGRPELSADERFADAEGRERYSKDCIEELEATFASAPLEHWRAVLNGASGVWSVVQTAAEARQDPQAIANGYLPSVQSQGLEFTVVASPVQFDEEISDSLERAPEHGEQTELVLLALGHDWDKLSELKDGGAIR